MGSFSARPLPFFATGVQLYAVPCAPVQFPFGPVIWATSGRPEVLCTRPLATCVGGRTERSPGGSRDCKRVIRSSTQSDLAATIGSAWHLASGTWWRLTLWVLRRAPRRTLRHGSIHDAHPSQTRGLVPVAPAVVTRWDAGHWPLPDR